MKRWKILDRDGFPPDGWLIPSGQVVEAATAEEAVRKSCTFTGNLVIGEEEGYWYAQVERPETNVAPLCHVCGPGKCVGHTHMIMYVALMVVEME